jgi:plasmid maintenance system antidote protein VapI
MKQAELANLICVTPQWFNAVVKGRSDAGKKFAQKIDKIIGGGLDVWMLESKRKSRKGLVDGFIKNRSQKV